MKKAITALTLLFATLLFAQEYPMPLVIEGKPTDGQYGLPQTMIYETILATNLSQKELITKISAGLVATRLVNQKDIKLDEITNQQKQFIIPGGFRGGTFAGKGKSMVSKRLKSPVILGFDIVFLFDESGKVRIQFTNLKEVAFIRINDQGQFHFVASMGSMLNPSTAPEDDRHTKLIEIQDKIMKTGTILGKATSFIEKGNASARLEMSANGLKITSNNGIKDAIKNLNVSLDEEWRILDKAVQDKVGVWIVTEDESFMELYQTALPKQSKMKELAAKRIGEKNLLVVDNDRFDKYFENLFNEMFIWSAIEINAKILGINKNGTPMYESNENYELKEVKTK